LFAIHRVGSGAVPTSAITGVWSEGRSSFLGSMSMLQPVQPAAARIPPKVRFGVEEIMDRIAAKAAAAGKPANGRRKCKPGSA